MISLRSLPLLLLAVAIPAILLAQGNASPVPGTSMAEQRAALVRAKAQAEEARKRSEALEARAGSADRTADRTRDQIAALAARIQQSEADQRAGEARIGLIAAMQRAQARRLAQRQKPIVRLTAALQQLARRLRTADQTIESDRAYASGPRLARYLKRLIRKDSVDAEHKVELSQTELGNFAGMSREHINRQLRSWEESGIIALEQGRVRVLDADLLEDISESEG